LLREEKETIGEGQRLKRTQNIPNLDAFYLQYDSERLQKIPIIKEYAALLIWVSNKVLSGRQMKEIH